MSVTREVALKLGFKNEARRWAQVFGSQMISITMKQTFSLECLYNLSLAVTHGAHKFWWAREKLTGSL